VNGCFWTFKKLLHCVVTSVHSVSEKPKKHETRNSSHVENEWFLYSYGLHIYNLSVTYGVAGRAVFSCVTIFAIMTIFAKNLHSEIKSLQIAKPCSFGSVNETAWNYGRSTTSWNYPFFWYWSLGINGFLSLILIGGFVVWPEFGGFSEDDDDGLIWIIWIRSQRSV
jgi:hypothetical protein